MEHGGTLQWDAKKKTVLYQVWWDQIKPLLSAYAAVET